MSTTYQATAAFAANLDATDELKDYRNRFHIPSANGKSLIYFCGNSLGLQPKSTRAYLEQELTDWQNLGVEGHLHAKNPWLYYHHFLTDATARLVGAKPIEVVVMNSLTVNLNLLMISFYRPTAKRNKIMMEYMAFPSDQYAVENQVKFHGYNPNEAIIELMPREGENCIRTADILAKIDEHKDELALIMIGGVNYYTGQLFDMATITSHAKNCSSDIVVGYDLAHATGGVFVHEKHAENNLLPRLSGWWGNDESTRFKMQKGFIPQQGAAGWQMSNAQVLSMAAHRASLAIFDEVGMDKLIAKSKLLTGYLEFLLLNGKRKDFKIITPEDVAQRGCQLSIVMNENGKKTFDALTQNGVIADWREPDVIRVAPVPLYNTFEDVYRFAEIFHAV